MAKTGKTEVVLNLKVSDGGLSLIFDKAKKGFARLSADQKESLKLQEKQDAAAKKYSVSKTAEGKAIQRTNAETREENRLATLSQANKVRVTKAVEKLTFANSAQNQKVQEHNILSREQNRIVNLEINQSIQLKKSKERLTLAQSQVGQETLKNNKLAIEAERIATLNLSRDIQLAKAQENIAFWTSKKGKELAKANLQAKEAANQASLLAIKEMEAADAAKELSNATKGAAKGFDQMKTTAGLSGAIVTEVGRTISDAPYGLRGMGNNISQLASLFGMFSVNVKKSGRTMTEGFKQLGASMLGPIGIITGVQILVALLQSGAFEKFFEWITKSDDNLVDLKESIDSVSSSFGTQIAELEAYVSVLEDSDAALEQQERAYKKIIDSFPEMEGSITRIGDEFVISADAVKSMREELETLALSSAALKKLGDFATEKLTGELEERVKINNSLAASEKLRENAIKRVSIADKERIKVLEKTIKLDKTEDGFNITTAERTAALSELNDIYDKTLQKEKDRLKQVTGESRGAVANKQALEDYIDSLETVAKNKRDLVIVQGKFRRDNSAEIEALKQYIKLGFTSSKIVAERIRKVKQFKENVFDLKTEIMSFEQELVAESFRTQQEIIKDEQKAKEDSIALKRDEFKTRQELRLKNYIAQQEANKDLKGADKEAIDLAINMAKARTAKSKIEADTEATDAIAAIKKVTKARISNQQELEDFEKKNAEAAITESGDATNLAMMPEGMAKVEAEAALDQLRYDNKVLAAERELALLTTTDERRREIATQMALWQDEKRATDLENEINVVNEKTRVQQEYIGFLSGLNSVLGAISNKSKAMQKVTLLSQKAAAIAGVVVEASKSIGVQTASHKAFVAKTNAKYAGVPGGAALASGYNLKNGVQTGKNIAKTKAGAALSIAAITAGTISSLSGSSSSGSGGGGGGATTVQAPDFNIIGSTGVNQLADVIGGTTQQPIKAYVVSSEVTSAQELDRNIIESASL